MREMLSSLINRDMKKFFGKYNLLFFVMVSVLIVVGGCRSKEAANSEQVEFAYEDTVDNAALAVTLRVDKQEITIADKLLVEFESRVDEKYELGEFKIEPLLVNFGLLDVRTFGKRIDDDGRAVVKRRYELEPFVSGSYEVPSFVFEIYDANDPERKVSQLETKAVTIEVKSLLGEDRDNLKISDISDVVDVHRAGFPVWPMVGATVVCVGLIAGLFLFKGRKKINAVRYFRRADEIAYEKLEKLVSQRLVEKGLIKEFYEQINNILRHYIEDRFKLRAPERTSEEFLYEISEDSSLSAVQKESLGKFLRHCDLVKFAKYSPTTEQIQQSFDLVKDFIEQTRSVEKTVEVAEDAIAEVVSTEEVV